MDRIEIDLGAKKVILEKGRMARQAQGAVWVQSGETIVLTTAVSSSNPREDVDFLPLMCEYREQTSAAGKIPGGFFKREGRPTEREVLTSRVIDRSIRPLFPEGYYHDIQITSLLLSVDSENDPEILAILGASAALVSSPIPFTGPVAAVRVGYVDGEFVLNPGISLLERSEINLLLSGTQDSIIMMEGSSAEIDESKFLQAIAFGLRNLKSLLEVQQPWIGEKTALPSVGGSPWRQPAEDFLKQKLFRAYEFKEKKARSDFYDSLREEFLSGCPEEEKDLAGKDFDISLKKSVRQLIASSEKRLDGRSPKEIRPIEIEVGLLPRNHGSALFVRGQTQCIASVTLGAKHDEQRIDGLFEETSKRFMLHYNFPPFCVGEAVPMRSPSRREIGHGALAERSLAYVIPGEEKFPYTIRIVANILESNGSSSMATVCAGSLALMDAGVPVSRHVAGIALGLIMESGQSVILTDIAGEEDHYGDVDLKIAGTEKGITGFQLDVKTSEFSLDILEKALFQSREARLEILEKMNSVLSQPRPTLSPYAPRMISFKIKPDKIGLVIGPGGKTIRGIIDRTGAEIDIEDDGTIHISSPSPAACEQAQQEVLTLIEEAAVGKVYTGVVTKILPFGALVKILPTQEGMVHISEISGHRIDSVEDMLSVGSEIRVKVIGIDESGRLRLSRKQTLTPEELAREKESLGNKGKTFQEKDTVRDLRHRVRNHRRH
ncbi:MAG: polyribonucleotide nucleotidyltransferase [Candidatus Omnitrophica bacterium]|nr:polyribonucleotide nucleotidyltransferase [Candidatus Omnitrophota bacterium]